MGKAVTTRIRIATFNLENLDDAPGAHPTLGERIALMRPQLVRVDADVLCLQEVWAQPDAGGILQLSALDALLATTQYESYQRIVGTKADGTPNRERNVVTLSRFNVAKVDDIFDFHPPRYQLSQAVPPTTTAAEITWERPILHGRVEVPGNQALHIVNLHLKSKLPSDIPGQRLSAAPFAGWKTAAAWAEGSFVSSMKRLSQAFATRILVDQILDAGEHLVAVCGDFNATLDEVALEALRGDIEDNENPGLVSKVMIPCERNIPEPARFSLIHHGSGEMIDHVLASRSLFASFRHAEVHNEYLHDESSAFATDIKYPESDHAPVVAEFEIP
jgi:endonuclease/exonuclease/phosphatase family metal-dependent hydrolase